MPETFYVRTRDLKHYIEAKILTDLTGNPIVSRNPVQSTWNLFDADHNPIGTNTNGYVIVPADFDINKAIDFDRSISEMMKASADNPDNFESNLIDALPNLEKRFTQEQESLTFKRIIMVPPATTSPPSAMRLHTYSGSPAMQQGFR